jgi:hypothetical protein
MNLTMLIFNHLNRIKIEQKELISSQNKRAKIQNICGYFKKIIKINCSPNNATYTNLLYKRSS